FFSSRRRHTRFSRDWSSDVCSSDLLLIMYFRNDTSAFDGKRIEQLDRKGMVNNKFNAFIMGKLQEAGIPTHFVKLLSDTEVLVRSEERRVGKECRSRCSQYH